MMKNQRLKSLSDLFRQFSEKCNETRYDMRAKVFVVGP